MADIQELKTTARKNTRRDKPERSHPINPLKTPPPNPMPPLFRQPNFPPSTPSTITMSPLKRAREQNTVFSDGSIIEELKTRHHNKDDLLTLLWD